jgi:hypothetical protein
MKVLLGIILSHYLIPRAGSSKNSFVDQHLFYLAYIVKFCCDIFYLIKKPFDNFIPMSRSPRLYFYLFSPIQISCDDYDF